MALIEALRFAMRTLHLGAMAVWLGVGLLYLLTRPSLNRGASAEMVRDYSRTMRMLVGRSFLLIVASGVYLSFDRLVNPRLGFLYVLVLALKLAAVAGTVLSVSAPRGGQTQPSPRGLYLTVWADPGRRTLALGAVALILGVVLTLIYEAGA